MSKEIFMKIFNKSKEITKKLIFVIEFVVSMFLAYSIFRFLVLKSYGSTFSLKHFIYILISLGIILYIIIYNIRKKEKIEKLAISFLIPIGLVYLMLVFPSVSPDESSHLFKAYEVSKGIFVSSIDEPMTVPRDLSVCDYVSTYGDFNEALSWNTDYNDEVERNNTFKAYQSYLYMFSSIGFVISRFFNLNIYIRLYISEIN